MMMLGWKGVVHSCLSMVLSRRFSVCGDSQGFAGLWPGHLEVDNLNVVQSIARLLDHGRLSKPLPLVKMAILLLLFNV